MSAASPPTLASLPAELLADVLQHLAPADLARTARACHRLHALAIPLLYAVCRLSCASELRDPWRMLEALRNPAHAAAVRFLDYVHRSTPDLSDTVDAYKDRFTQRRYRPHAPPALPDPPSPIPYEASENLRRANLRALRTLRIVGGVSPPLMGVLLSLPLHSQSLRRLWIESISPFCLSSFLAAVHNDSRLLRLDELLVPGVPDNDVRMLLEKLGRPEVQGECFPRTGLTHLRVRKLSPCVDDSRATRLARCLPRCMPDFFLSYLLPRCPHLTSLTLDDVDGFRSFFPDLDCLTFPSLTAFQLRNVNEQGSVSRPAYLIDDKMLGFLKRHPLIEAFAWPAERFVPSQEFLHSLDPVIEQFSRRLVWLRSDCISFRYYARRSSPCRYSRMFLARLLGRMQVLETLKLQGDFQDDEMLAYFDAIARTRSRVTKFSLIRLKLNPELLPPLVRAMPDLEVLKLCAYLRGTLVHVFPRFRHGDQDGEDQDGDQDGEDQDGGDKDEHPFGVTDFLDAIAPLKRLTTLTIPCTTFPSNGANHAEADRTAARIWDAYRSAGGGLPTADSIGVSRESVELDMEVRRQEHMEFVTQFTNAERAPMLCPALIVGQVESMLGSRFPALRCLRLFFILDLSRTVFDCHELLLNLRWLPAVGEEANVKCKTVLAGAPVLSYEWGINLWMGPTKDLETRAWF